MKSTLAISGGGREPRYLSLEEGSTTIGRADTNAIVLDHANISHSHMEIRIDSSGVQIADLNSVNGTKVNDVKLPSHAWQPLHPGDCIEAGPFQMSFDQEVDGSATVVMNRTVVMPRTRPPSPAPAPLPPPPPGYVHPESIAQVREPVASAPIPDPVAPVAPLAVPVAPTPIPDPFEPPPPPLSGPPEPLATPDPGAVEPALAESPSPEATAHEAPRYVTARSGREKVGLVLLAMAVVLTLTASFAVWNQRVLLNQDKFVSLGNEVLSKPAVQRELAAQLSKEIDSTSSNLLEDLGVPKGIEQLGKDVLDSIFGVPSPPSSPGGTTSGGGVLDSIMLDTIRTLPNTPVSDSALIATHSAMKTAVRDSSVSAKNDVIVLDIGDGMSQLFGLAGIVGVSSNDLGGDFGRIEITKDADTVRAVKLIRFFDGKAMLLVVLVIAALVAGMYISKDRIRYVRYSGLALVGSSVLWILAAMGPVKPWVLGDGGDSESAKAAIKATYDVIASSFIRQELIVVGAGVVLLAIGLIQSSRAATASAVMTPPVTGNNKA